MATARRRPGALTDAERESLVAEVRQQVLSDVQNVLHAGNDLDAIRDHIDEQLEAYEAREINVATVRDMSAEEINENWETVSAVMAASGQTTAPASDPPADRPRRTGQQLRSESDSPTPLSMDMLRQQSAEWHAQHRAEVEQFLAQQGASS